MITTEHMFAERPRALILWNSIRTLTAVVILSVLLLVSFSCSKDTPGKSNSAATKPVNARVIPVESKEIRRNVESVGSLFAYEEVTVSSEIEGRVDDVLVDVGDRVSRGQPMVKVSPVELQYALDQQRAALRMARARLGLSENGPELKDVRDAAEVKKAAADLNDADQKYRRAKAMMDQGLVPQQNLAEVEAKYKSARAAYDLAVQTGDRRLTFQVFVERETLFPRPAADVEDMHARLEGQNFQHPGIDVAGAKLVMDVDAGQKIVGGLLIINFHIPSGEKFFRLNFKGLSRMPRLGEWSEFLLYIKFKILAKDF